MNLASSRRIDCLRCYFIYSKIQLPRRFAPPLLKKGNEYQRQKIPLRGEGVPNGRGSPVLPHYRSKPRIAAVICAVSKLTVVTRASRSMTFSL